MEDIYAKNELYKEGFTTIKEARAYIQELSKTYPVGRIRGLEYTLLTNIEDMFSDNCQSIVRFKFDNNFKCS